MGRSICLILPKYAVSISDPCCYPLGFMHVSSHLKALGHEVKVLNFNLWSYDLAEEMKGCDLACFTGSDEFFEFNRDASLLALKMDLETWWGGAMATFAPEKLVSYCDTVYRGEIDAEIPIDEIPWPDYEAFGIDEYHRRHDRRYMGVLTSRGCPFNCTFCAQVGEYRERDLARVKEEIEHYIAKYGIDMLIFNDNTLNAKKSRFMQVCDIMKEFKIEWSAAIRADVMDEEMAIAAKASGCTYFVIGIESFRQNRLDRMNKKLRVEDIRRTLDLLHRYKIGYHGNIMLGLDGETQADIAQEVAELPSGYNLFPVLAQTFAGTKVRSCLTKDERTHLNGLFTEYAQERGMGVYPLT